MTGTNSLSELAFIAPHLLNIEAVVIGLFLIFAMFAVWTLREDPAILLPKTRIAEFITLAILSSLWFLFSCILGIDQVILALELALAILISTIHPAIASGFFIILLFLRPWEIAQTGSTLFLALPRGFAFLAIFTSLFYLMRSKRMTLRLGTPITLVLVFSIWVFLSTFKSGDPALAQSTFFDLFFKSVIIFLLVTQTIRDRNGFRILCSAFTFAALGISLIALYRTFALPESSAERVGSVGLLADPNDAAAIMILIFPFALASLKRRTPAFFFKIICLVTLSTSLLMVYFSKSRGALLSILIMFASMFILKFRNKGRAVLVSILVLALFVPVSSMFHRSESDRTESVDSRIIYWKTGAIMAFRSPIFGVGFNGYPENFEKYAPNIIESGYRTAHSSWILALAETGFLGFLLFSSLFVWAIRTAWKLRPEYPELFFATLGYGVAMSFLSHTYLIYFYLLVALIFVASRFPESTSPP